MILNRVSKIKVENEYVGQRLDNFLIRHLKGAPKSLIYRIIRKGEVRINRGRVEAKYRLQLQDEIRIPPVKLDEQPLIPKPKHGQILEDRILFEDDDLLIINKPAGWAVHGGSGVSLGIIETFRETRKPHFLELVHRLDKGTSGCLILAKNRLSLVYLQSQLKNGLMNKYYLALLNAKGLKQTKVNAPLRKSLLKTGERWVVVDPNGKPAETHFKLEAVLKGVILVQAKPITGRTHQIRVHAAFMNSPIVGDERYGERGANRAAFQMGVKGLCLHAKRLEFDRPNGQGSLTIEAPHELPLQLYN